MRLERFLESSPLWNRYLLSKPLTSKEIVCINKLILIDLKGISYLGFKRVQCFDIVFKMRKNDIDKKGE